MVLNRSGGFESSFMKVSQDKIHLVISRCILHKNIRAEIKEKSKEKSNQNLLGVTADRGFDNHVIYYLMYNSRKETKLFKKFSQIFIFRAKTKFSETL